MELHPDFQEFLRSFVDHDVRFNASRVIQALDDLGFGGLGLSAADFEDPDMVVQLEIGGVPVPFVSVDDLRTNKMATGRLRDRADVADLAGTDSDNP